MASETFEYHYYVNAPAERVYEHLAEPANYIGLSPLVTAAYDIEHSTDAQGHAVVRYVSVETFTFLGFIRYNNHIRVTMTMTQPNQQIISDVDSPMSVKVHFVFDLESEGAGTQVHETVIAQMPSPLRGFVVREAKSVQVARAQILKQRLETAG